ncbi:protein of unknown function [Cardinium endosymbiont cEper1 of Encarsia pergandiella]|nr:protein of unknown function [Cardinium endosymbiont cEper1 of Encarsia pergandiella]
MYLRTILPSTLIAKVYNQKLSKDLRNAIIKSKIERNKRFKNK